MCLYDSHQHDALFIPLNRQRAERRLNEQKAAAEAKAREADLKGGVHGNLAEFEKYTK